MQQHANALVRKDPESGVVGTQRPEKTVNQPFTTSIISCYVFDQNGL